MKTRTALFHMTEAAADRRLSVWSMLCPLATLTVETVKNVSLASAWLSLHLEVQKHTEMLFFQ